MSYAILGADIKLAEHYDPTDLLNLEESDFLSLRERLMAGIKDAITVLTFRSKVIEDYFYEVSTVHTKRHVRVALKFMMFFCYSLVVSTPIMDYTDTTNLYFALIFLSFTIICYFITFRPLTHRIYGFISVFLVILFLSCVLYHYKDGSRNNMEMSYTPGVQLIVIMYAVLPLRLELALCIGILYTVSYQILSTLRVQQKVFGNRNCSTILTKECDEFNKTVQAYTMGQLSLWLASHFAGFYLHICNQLRRRASFLRLGENVKAQNQVKEAMRGQVKCIEAIMPTEVKDAYWEKRKACANEEMWVYSKMYNNVSIFFADIVGFTNMSSNKTAPQVVTLLNDLFNRFDEMCTASNCEKLGTLGDCYYGVAGCPNPSLEHAKNCIEMGLGMCRIIKAFNIDHNESVNMRVGVHTGRVNAAIIGSQRFRFDVYSYDVILANEMESSGQPGRVHISEATYAHVKDLYDFEEGELYEVKREELKGIAGMALTTTLIKTFFVMAETSHLLQMSQAIELKKTADLKIADDKEPVKDRVTEISMEFPGENEDQNRDQLDADMLFIDMLKKDPDKQINLFRNLPVWSVTLQFMDISIEHCYHTHTTDDLQPMFIDSVKLAPLLDSIFCLAFTAFIIVASIFFFPKQMGLRSSYVTLVIGIGCVFTVVIGWSSFQLSSMITNKYKLMIFRVISYSVVKNIQSFYLCSLPSIITLLMLDCEMIHVDYLYTTSFYSNALFSIMCIAVFVSSYAWVNIFSGFIFGTTFLMLILLHPEEGCISKKEHILPERWLSCDKLQYTHYGNNWYTVVTPMVLHLTLCFGLMILMCRENEHNLRLCFYVAREAQIRSDHAKTAMVEAGDLLHNIIPKYVFDLIIARGGDIAKGGFSYAVSVPRVGVIFACISNFFSSYYREDYKGGEGALMMLNKIICMFDTLYRKRKYSAVEKIKTINDCYMVAAGLNVIEVKKSRDPKRHLFALMDFAFDMQKTLKDFNDSYIIGKDKFCIKIGYNIGPVTAGIIGTTKPMYDIWGDTVNVSSRMYSTGAPGLIQVPSMVRDQLVPLFDFQYRDKITVKGKGLMDTYVCLGRSPKTATLQFSKK